MQSTEAYGSYKHSHTREVGEVALSPSNTSIVMSFQALSFEQSLKKLLIVTCSGVLNRPGRSYCQPGHGTPPSTAAAPCCSSQSSARLSPQLSPQPRAAPLHPRPAPPRAACPHHVRRRRSHCLHQQRSADSSCGAGGATLSAFSSITKRTPGGMNERMSESLFL
jgi:hypothetical protein